MGCIASPVLKAAFNSPFIEDQIQTYAMEDIDPAVFESFVKWLYTGKLNHKFFTISEICHKVSERR